MERTFLRFSVASAAVVATIFACGARGARGTVARPRPSNDPIMKKARRGKRQNLRGELAPSYRFDYSKAKPNRFARKLAKESVIVVLDPDVARVYRNSKSVNSALRSAMSTKTSARKRSRRVG